MAEKEDAPPQGLHVNRKEDEMASEEASSNEKVAGLEPLTEKERQLTGFTAEESEDHDDLTYAERALRNGMQYTVADVPPLGKSILLGVQHYLTMLGATVLIPLLVTPAMGASKQQTAEVICTIFFVSGINTLLQTSIGDRLPIVQGGSFSFLPATFGIIFNPELQAITDDNARFLATMQTIQGGLISVGLMQVAIGYTGLVVPCLRFVSPITVACVIAAIGLGLYGVAFNGVSNCFAVGLVQILTLIVFSQYLKKVTIRGVPYFQLFPVVLSIAVTWTFAAILTAANVWEEGSQCRTDAAGAIISAAPWFRFPYPFQWGSPIFKSYAVVPMIGSMLASMIESIGDYYAAANLAGAPPPTPGIISRGLASEGIGVVLAGLWGTGSGTTSYSENIGAISITGVGSRAVVQCGAVVMIIVSIIAKFGALLASMPGPMVSGVYCVVFGLIVGVGLSNLQHIDLNSPRNLFIVGFAIFNCLSVAGPGGYFAQQDDNPFGTTNGAQIALSLFSSPMIIAFICTLVMDNTIAGTREERGMQVWDQVKDADVNNDPEYVRVYSLPLFFAKAFRNCGYLEYPSLGRMPPPPAEGYQASRGDIGDLCCPCFFPKPEDVEAADDKLAKES